MTSAPLISTKFKWVFVISTIFTLGWMLLMSITIKPLNSKDIVSFELAKTPDVAAKIMLEWEEKELIGTAKKSIYLDFVFLILYSLAIAFGCLVLSVFTGNDYLILVGEVLSKIVPFAGLFDVFENLAMLTSLSGGVTILSTTIAYWFAAIKFLIILFALIFVLSCLIFGGLKRIK